MFWLALRPRQPIRITCAGSLLSLQRQKYPKVAQNLAEQRLGSRIPQLAETLRNLGA